MHVSEMEHEYQGFHATEINKETQLLQRDANCDNESSYDSKRDPGDWISEYCLAVS
jgi:hypothetical protein